jgi:hypothetical protein
MLNKCEVHCKFNKILKIFKLNLLMIINHNRINLNWQVEVLYQFEISIQIHFGKIAILRNLKVFRK